MLELRGRRQTAFLDLARLRLMPRRTMTVVLECAGHRRNEFQPLPPGLPWACGAVAEAQWTGVSLRGLLQLAGIPEGTREVVLEGADAGAVEGFNGVHHFARSLPLEKALERDVLLTYEMNGAPIPERHGGPVRAIVPGWYATDSVKWLTRVWFTPEEFGGVFQAHDYRLRAPDEIGPGRRMTDVPVNSLITTPVDGELGLPAGEIVCRGIAWGGAGGVERVLVQADRGPWLPTRLDAVGGPYSRIIWEVPLTVAAGVHEISARAIDAAGNAQPARPAPNVRGYGNHAMHRVSVRAV
jgi:DMSO/TMAO reductase YedYZ molybdopterin-dependent catalytic subunit